MTKVNTQMFLDSADRAEHAKVDMEPIEGMMGYSIVSFSTEEKRYKVTLRRRNVAGQKALFIYSCDCPHYEHRRLVCKHMIAVSLQEKIDIIQLHRDAIEKVNKEYKQKNKKKAIQIAQ